MNRVVARVDLGAIRSNLARMRALAGSADVMVVVKADAYGHGMIPVARTVRQQGTAWLGVALPSEALVLRAAGDTGRILAWLWTPGDAAVGACVRQGVDLSVSSRWALAEVVEAARRSGERARVHIKVDTGLIRNGAGPDELPLLLAQAREAVEANLIEVVGIWSHLADGDTPDAVSVTHQRRRFEDALAQAAAEGIHPSIRHLSNSGAVFAHPDCRYDLVRSGIAVYGLSPAPVLGASSDLGLVPAMTLVAELAHVKRIDPGTAVSYGWRWAAPTTTTVGLLPVGYADGLPRSAGAPAATAPVEVTVGGRRVPIVGTVAMDQCVLDLGPDATNVAGDEAVLFGPGRRGEATADEWAATMGTIGYEIVTRIGPRVPREHVGEEAPA